MNKYYYSLGLMSGTSGDGVDASIIQSDGDTQYKVILDKYFEYSKDIYQDLSDLRDKINDSTDLKKLLKDFCREKLQFQLQSLVLEDCFVQKLYLRLEFLKSSILD